MNILKEAMSITQNARKVDYGDAKQSFEKIANLASILCGKNLNKYDIINVQIAVKLIRESYKHKRDNLVDVCGYTRLLSILKGDEDTKK